MSEALAKAISHPLRAQLLGRLGERPGSAKQLSEEFNCHPGNSAYHVRKLHDLGLIEIVERVQRRGAAERIYRATRVEPAAVDVPAILGVEDWKEKAEATHRALTTIETVRGRSVRRRDRFPRGR